MFPFRKPPTKLEVAKKSVSDAAHSLIEAIPAAQIEEKFEDLKKSAALAAVAAAGAAHHAGEIAAHKLEEVKAAASHLGEGVAGAAHNAQNATQGAAALAAAKAGAAAHSARETAHNARETLGEKAKSAAQFTGNLKERAAHDFQIGGKEAQHAKQVAQQAAEREAEALKARAAATEAKKQAKLLEKEAQSAQKDAESSVAQAKKAAASVADAAREQAEDKVRAAAQTEAEAVEEMQNLSAKSAKKAAKIEAKARAAAGKAAEKVEHRVESQHDEGEIQLAEVQVADGGAKWGWIIIGLALGAILVLLFAPTTGRRSRAAIKDRLGRVGDGAVDAATATADKVVDIAQRVEGLTHKVDAKLAADGETDDDTTVADRVRSILGHHEVAKTIERLNIDCADGVVTLRGPMIDQAMQEILVTAVKTVPGVKDVVADFVDEASESPTES